MQKYLKLIIALFVLVGLYFTVVGIMSLTGQLGLKITARLTYGQTQILTAVVCYGFAVLFGIFGDKQ